MKDHNRRYNPMGTATEQFFRNDPTPPMQKWRKEYDPEEIMAYVDQLEDDTGNAMDSQVGGSHYKDMPFQPIDFIMGNNLGFCEGNAIKYICRYKSKGGVQDLDKAIHYLEMLKESYDGNN